MHRSWMAVVVAIALAVTACTGTDSVDGSTSTAAATSSSSATSTAPTTSTTTPTTTSTEPPATSTTVPATTSTSTTVAPTPAPGPPPGSSWAVTGVRHDDVLNVRSAPGVGAPIVGELAPTATDLVASGEAMLLGSVIWWHVTVDPASGLDVEGWASSRYLAALGATDDITSAVTSANGGVRPDAETMADLAAVVVGLLGGGDVVVVVAPNDPVTAAGGIGEITVDRFVTGDDAIRGGRLVIFGQRITDDGVIGLYAVEATSLCWRGADGTGLCV